MWPPTEQLLHLGPADQMEEAKLPTWEQLKKLSEEADKCLRAAQTLQNLDNLLVAMMAVITYPVCVLGTQAASYQYWIYVPFSHLVLPELRWIESLLFTVIIVNGFLGIGIIEDPII